MINNQKSSYIDSKFLDACFSPMLSDQLNEGSKQKYFAQKCIKMFKSELEGNYTAIDKNTYNTLLTEFLEWASIQGLDMGWRLNLYFLSWVHSTGKVQLTDEFSTDHMIRSAVKWINAFYEDIEYSGVSVFFSLDNKSCIISGWRNKTLCEKPKICKHNVYLGEKYQGNLAYSILKKPIPFEQIKWETV